MKISYRLPGSLKALRLAFVVALVVAAMSINWERQVYSPSPASADVGPSGCVEASGTCGGGPVISDNGGGGGGGYGYGGCAMGGGNYQASAPTAAEIEAEERRQERNAELRHKREQMMLHDGEARAHQERDDWAQAAISWAKAYEFCELAENCEIMRNALRQAQAMSLGLDALAVEKNGDWERSVEIWQDALSLCNLSEYCNKQTFSEFLHDAQVKVEQLRQEAEENRKRAEIEAAEEEERRRLEAEIEAAEERRRQDAAAKAEAHAEADEAFRREIHMEAETDEERRRQAYAQSLDDGAAKQSWESARVMLYDGRWADAEYFLRRYLEANPGDPWSHSRLGYALLKQGRYGEAVEANRRAVHLAPTDAVLRGDLVMSLDDHAWSLALEGKTDQARRLYSEAVSIAEVDAELRSKLADMLNETYQAAAGLANAAALREMAARALVRLDPASVYNQVLLGETLFASGDAAGAKAAYSAAAKLRPDDAELNAHTAKRLAELGEPKTAPETSGEPIKVFEAEAPDAIGQACGIAGVSSDACPKSLKLRGMNVETRFSRLVASIPKAAQTPAMAVIIEEGQKIIERVEENERWLNEVHKLTEQSLINPDVAEISRVENEIKDDQARLKKAEKKLTSFSLQAKLKQLNAGLTQDKGTGEDGADDAPSTAPDTDGDGLPG